MNGISIINTDHAPKPVGPYSQAVAAGGFLYTSGQIAIEPASGRFIGGSVEEQTELVLKNLKAVLEAKNADFGNVTAVQIFLIDMKDFSRVNRIYEQALRPHTPARTTVEVSALPLQAKIEISMTAFTG